MPRAAGLHRLASLVLLGLLSGCAAAPPAPVARDPLPRELRPFLLDPTDPADARPEVAEARRIHLQLVGSGDAATAERAAAGLLARAGDLAPALVVLAQAHLVAGDLQASLDAARASSAAGGLAARLVEARALEGLGDLPSAVAVYLAQAGNSELAAERARTLEPRAVEILGRRVDEALGRGQLDVAQRELERLEQLRPHAETTLRLGLALATAQGDRPRELTLVRRLVAAQPGDRALALRRGQLEMEVGDARVGLDLLQGLAEAAPGDVALAEELGRAKFRWRVLNAPEPVRRAAARPQISRADLAVLLYWMVPQVRTAHGGSARIASDILDHPAQEAIARVVNRGLLGVDETLHRFDPDRAARRSELYRALLRLLSDADPGGCAGADAGGGDPAREGACRSAAACGLTAAEAECLPSAPLSGAEALEALRRALALLERR